MRSDGIPEIPKPVSRADRVDAQISPAVGRRLRVLVVLRGGSLSSVLSEVLDGALPPMNELAAQLVEGEAVA